MQLDEYLLGLSGDSANTSREVAGAPIEKSLDHLHQENVRDVSFGEPCLCCVGK
jgi:hypothetical protein